MIYFAQLKIGQTYQSAGRTVTESDIQAFAGVSGDFNPLHTDVEWVRAHTDFPGRIAHGLLVLAIGSGIRTPGIDELHILGYLEVQRKMIAPVYPGDTVRVMQTIEGLAPSRSRAGAGVVHVRVETRNQNDEIVQDGIDTLFVGGEE
ncbi:MaoC family dehydratase N-terminal domain-containing protein [Leucobacter rhizosphaerae]|uniref:MaoC family dehydratase N-terminal domain-containing protein n=1 Tax=Leucobacter rhizosphaerae TaxID=2932245 RepID=A0ABY4FU98_9MICO|nr:MaoC/PaaZ C-terminal domain-containing protein [Leucobacter rhizosphaerae]UOQ59827.1 MaoC family dehydratase N-terminal domain-containing protein [Leucobacter rhizosphaerae]